MVRRYLRANPNSKVGKNFTEAESNGWKLVAFNSMGQPIFRQTFKSWFLEKYFGKKVWGDD